MSTNPKYPYAWGASIVNMFVEKYARGTYFLAKIANTSPGNIRKSLIDVICQGNSVRWESVKRMIKILEDYTSEEIKRFTPEERELLYKWYLYLSEDETIDSDFTKIALTTSKKKLIL